jgi:ABC-type branched-subunit amino acid transport system substrate-binding protein
MNVITTTNRSRRRRVAAFGLAIALVAAGCGNRSDDAGDDNGTDATAVSQTTTAASQGDRFGTLEVPCGAGDATGSTDKGVTDSTITIGVISDKNAGAIRVPTAGIEPSMQAFVKWCNGLGGINGRKLQLKTYDAKLLNSLEAAKQACDDQPFALVGTGVVQDAPMAQPLVDCGLISVSGYTATYPMTASPLNVEPVPNLGNVYATGTAEYFAKHFGDAIDKSAIFYPTQAAAADQASRAVQAREKLGYGFIYTDSYPVIQTDWKTPAQTMKNKGVEYVTMVDTVNAAIGMLEALRDADYHPQVIDLGQQYYDSTLAASGVADGVYVQTNTQPFENPSPAISEYVKILHDYDANVAETSLGVQAFSAALLFATVAKKLGSDLTRDALLKDAKAIDDWTGGGLHPPQDLSGKKTNVCTMILKVEKGEFVKVYPDNDSDDPTKSFDCDPAAITEVHGDWGKAPTRK